MTIAAVSMLYITESSLALQSVYQGPVSQLAIEACLLLGVIWLIFKKNDNSYALNLTKTDEENIIKAYKPEKLVEDIEDKEHCALRPRIVSGKIGMFINVDGIDCINFSSHDYFGFIGNDVIEEKVMSIVDVYGVGSCGPRGFYGTTLEHVSLEKLLADTFETEDSLVYSYGFVTAASAIPAYGKKADIIFADEKVNFAIQQGLKASRSEIKLFKHNDTKDLEIILENVRKLDMKNTRKAGRSRRYLVVEGIYINTGEICPLPELVQLCKKYKLRIFVDESVSFGVLGRTGKGVTEYFGVPRADIDLTIGSLEFALASVGGFCAASRLLIDHQQISGQGYCFSASLPPLLATAAAESLQAIQSNPQFLVRLNDVCSIMHCALHSSDVIKKHFEISGSKESPVHVLGVRKSALRAHQEEDEVVADVVEWCLRGGLAVTRSARLPSDCALSPSLRLTMCVSHTQDLILHLVTVLENACKNIFFGDCNDF